MEGMVERASDNLLKERAGESGEEMEEAMEGGSGRACSGGVRAALQKVRGAPRLVEMGAQPLVIQREGRWASQAFMGYVR